MGKIRDLKPKDSEDVLAPLGVLSEEDTTKVYRNLAYSGQINGFRKPVISRKLQVALVQMLIGAGIGSVITLLILLWLT